MPPVFRALRSAGHGLVSAGRAAFALVCLSVLVPGTVLDARAADADVRANAVSATVLPQSDAAHPGVSTSGPGPAETAREPGGTDGQGGGRRSRVRGSAFAELAPARWAEAARVRAAERERLGHTSALHGIAAGHDSFHCDTPPPARA